MRSRRGQYEDWVNIRPERGRYGCDRVQFKVVIFVLNEFITPRINDFCVHRSTVLARDAKRSILKILIIIKHEYHCPYSFQKLNKKV
jgi:hypothetical protein